MRYLLSRARISARAFNKVAFYRAHPTATGRFTTISPQGTPVTREIEIWIGDPGSACVMLDPEIGKAFHAGFILQGGCSLTQDPELSPMTFYHNTRHFSHNSSPYPRLEIPQDLGQQSNVKSSPATLPTWCITHAITLDGTADAGFQHSIRETMQRLQPVLDQLKDT